jgi:hypothetical protein
VGVPQFVHESDASEYLPQKVLNQFEREASVFIFFDDFIERQAEGLEDHAEVLAVIEGMLVSHYSLLVALVSFVDVLDNFLLDFGRLDVLLDGPDDLDRGRHTFIA